MKRFFTKSGFFLKSLMACATFVLNIGTMCAGTSYGSVTGAVHYETADGPAQGGKIYISTSNVEIGSIAEGDWSTSPAVNITSTTSSGWSGLTYANTTVYLYAQADEGYEFYGWYGNFTASDWAEWGWNGEFGDFELKSSSAKYAYTVQPLTETVGSPTEFPVYALFGPKRYQGSLRIVTADATKGMVRKYGYTGDDWWGNPQYGWNSYSASTQTEKETIVPTGGHDYGTTSATTTQALAVRGYEFAYWSKDANTNYSDSTVSSGAVQVNATVKATSLDPDDPTIGVLTANFQAATPKTITVKKLPNAGTISVQARNTYVNGNTLSTDATNTVATIAKEPTESNVDWYASDSRIILSATAESTHRFLGWYNKDEVLVTTNAKCTLNVAAKDTILEARFEEGYRLYYAATADTTIGGRVQVAFTEDFPNDAPDYKLDSTDKAFVTSAQRTAYFKANPRQGYVFVGWKDSPAGGFMSYDLTYSKTFTVTSTSKNSPTTCVVYAYFEPESADEAQLINGETGAIARHGNLSTVINAVGGKNTLVVLLKNIDLGSTPQIINKNMTLDFNSHTISGSVTDLVQITGGTTKVSFVENSPKGGGGIRVVGEAASAMNAVTVTSGATLDFNSGLIYCKNTSSDASVKTVGVSIASGTTLNLSNGEIKAETDNAYAYGLDVQTGATANLVMGTINAKAASDAYGVLANGTAKVTWSVAVNAETTTGNNAVGVLVNNAAAVATLDGGSITATAGADNAYGVWAKQASTTVTIGGSIKINATATGTNTTAYAVKEDGVAVNVETGRFATNNTKEMIAATDGNLKLYGGYYAHDVTSNIADGVIKGSVTSGKFYDEGYHYVLSNGDNPNYVVATANGKKFSSLEDAILYANNNPDITMTIRLEVSEYTLPAGNYTIPAKASLLIPYQQSETSITSDPSVSYADNKTPAPFCKLILASGVKMDVYGKMQMGGKRSAKGQVNANNGTPHESYGWLHMNSGSSIVLANGSHFYAWGFVTGAGEIDARRGSTVYEFIQIKDWKGGTATSNMPQGKAFPFNQYYVQNIECPVTYHPGAAEKCAGSVNALSSAQRFMANFIGINGTGSLFMMDDADESEDTWVRKRYDAAHDSLVFEINNSASLGSLSLYGYSSSAYVLPVTNNMRFHVLNGSLEITENVELLPGSVIEVDKKATASLKANKSLYIFDAEDWMIQSYTGNTTAHTCVVPYFPTWAGNGKTCPRGTVITTDASINVHGTIEINGKLYTTAGGANIHSSEEDAGTIIFKTTAPAEATSVYVKNNTTSTDGQTAKTANPAWLQNESGDPTYTADKSGSFCYLDIDGTGAKWTQLVQEGCFVKDMADPSNPVYYAKPQGYVALSSNTPDGDHLYHSATGSHDYILVDECQWWEVEPVAENEELVHCTHPDNDTYYFWDTSLGTPSWNEKLFAVSWNNWDGTPLLDSDDDPIVYPLPYKSMPHYNGTNPTREMNDYYTYDFIGWLPELAPVTSDVTYTAQFQQNDRKYMITFQDADGSVLEETLCKMGEVPVCVNQPTPQGKILVWEPTIGAVTGDATYRATYIDEAPTSYLIKFVNWNGTVLQEGNVDVDVVPTYTGATPTKPEIADKAFEFIGWTPDLAPVSQAAIYTATFQEKPAEYTVTFMRAVANDGTGDAIDPAVEIEHHTYAYGEMPVCSNLPTKTYTGEGNYYYEVVWDKNISAVTGNATYTVTGFELRAGTCLFTLKAGEHGSVSMSYTEPETTVAPEPGDNSVTVVLDYGKQVTLTATADEHYHFVRWSDGNENATRTFNITATTLRAEFAIDTYEITWVLNNGQPNETTVVNYGDMPAHGNPAKATTDEAVYTFTGWSPAIVAANGDETYTAQYASTTRTYTIRFVLNNGMPDIVQTLEYGEDPTPAEDPVRATQNGVSYTFIGWDPAIGNVEGNATYTAQWESEVTDLKAGNSEDANAKDLALTETGMEAQTLTIEATGTVNVTSDASVTVQNLILESNGTNSGQLLGTSSARLTINEHAYFDLTLNAQRRTWYAVAVPWAVDCRTGISIKGGRKLVLGRDFDLVYYQGNVRASEGAGYQCWKYAEDPDGDKIMHPGRAYMMYFGSEIETIRFENYDDTPFDDAELTVGLYDASEAGDANWNGVANPKTYHATLAAGGATYGYYLNNGRVDEYMVGEGEPTYKLVNLASYNAIVGKPLFIQAVNTNAIATTPKIAAAPRRIREIEIEEGIETVYEITFGAEGSANKDNIFIQTVETKEEGYVIGQDLLKAGMSAKLPQLWINQYGKKLSVNTATPMNGVHEYPLTLNIPQSGDYTIAIESTQGDTEALYLIKNGNVIWNLSNGEYTGTFEKGTDVSYSLRTAAKAPQTTTGIDNAVIDANGEIRKMLIDNHVYIIRGNEVYTIEGQLVK